MKRNWILLLIVLGGLFIRLWQVQTLPSILNRDEAALAYNALLLKQNGKDEWGRSWPLVLESFGDYKLPGYSLSLVGLFTIFGMSDVVVRLPSAVAGTLLIAVGYAFVRKLGWERGWATILALVIAVSPVFVFYSRMAFEANVGLFLLVTLLYLLWFPWQKQWLSFCLALIIAMAAIFTYNTPFILLPFVIASLPLIRGWRNAKSWAPLTISLLVIWIAAAAVLLPLNSRKSGITLFSSPLVYHEYTLYRQELSPLLQKVIGSKYAYWAGLAWQNTLASFSPDFLVKEGGSHPWHQVPGTAHLYWVVYVLAMFGIGLSGAEIIQTWIVKRKLAAIQSGSLFFLSVSLIPAVITVDAPHATRSLFFLLLLCYFAVWAIKAIYQRLRPLHQKVFLGLVTLILLFEATLYGYRYFVKYPQLQSALQPGYVDALGQYYADHGSPAVVFDAEGYHYIITAWYQRLQPTVFYATIRRDPPDTIGFSYVNQTGDVLFVKSSAEARERNAPAMLYWDDFGSQWQIKLQ